MRIRELACAIAAGAMLLMVAGCASTRAPLHWLPSAERATREASGGWFYARVGTAESTTDVLGELLAAEDDSVFVLTTSGFDAIPTGIIRSAQVAGYDVNWSAIAGWWVGGLLSTASHGILLLLSAPVWIIVGTSSTVAASNAPIVRHGRHGWSELSVYARFPQGLPPNLDRASLHLRGPYATSEPPRASQAVTPR